MAGFSHDGPELAIFEYASRKPGERPQKLVLQWVPQKVGRSRSPQLASLVAYGNNFPQLHYTGGSEKIAFSVQFYATEEEPDIVAKAFAFLRSLAQNDGNDGDSPVVGIAWGRMYRGIHLKLSGYNETAYEHGGDEEQFEEAMYPSYGEADLTFEVVDSGAVSLKKARERY